MGSGAADFRAMTTSLSKTPAPEVRKASSGVAGYSCRKLRSSPAQLLRMHQRRQASCLSSSPKRSRICTSSSVHTVPGGSVMR
jgi:hypothetical protein